MFWNQEEREKKKREKKEKWKEKDDEKELLKFDQEQAKQSGANGAI